MSITNAGYAPPTLEQLSDILKFGSISYDPKSHEEYTISISHGTTHHLVDPEWKSNTIYLNGHDDIPISECQDIVMDIIFQDQQVQ